MSRLNGEQFRDSKKTSSSTETRHRLQLDNNTYAQQARQPVMWKLMPTIVLIDKLLSEKSVNGYGYKRLWLLSVWETGEFLKFDQGMLKLLTYGA